MIQTQVASTIIAEINAHMRKFTAANNGWYVGITSDVEERQFGYHQVSKQNGVWIYRYASNSEEAREIEAAYHAAGCKGAGGGGDETATCIYAYMITSFTVE